MGAVPSSSSSAAVAGVGAGTTSAGAGAGAGASAAAQPKEHGLQFDHSEAISSWTVEEVKQARCQLDAVIGARKQALRDEAARAAAAAEHLRRVELWEAKVLAEEAAAKAAEDAAAEEKAAAEAAALAAAAAAHEGEDTLSKTLPARDNRGHRTYRRAGRRHHRTGSTLTPRAPRRGRTTPKARTTRHSSRRKRLIRGSSDMSTNSASSEVFGGASNMREVPQLQQLPNAAQQQQQQQHGVGAGLPLVCQCRWTHQGTGRHEGGAVVIGALPHAGRTSCWTACCCT